MAAIPICVWVSIWQKFRPESKDMLVMAFIAGCFSTAMVILYQKLWGNTINIIFFEFTPINFKHSLSEFSTEYFMQKFLVFVFGVGMMEEVVKHFVIRKEKPGSLVVVALFALVASSLYVIYQLLFGSVIGSHALTLLAAWGTFYTFVLVHKRLKFNSIDQVIMASIMSALGFAFIENILYGTRILAMRDMGYGSTAMILTIRSIFTVMIHMLCSGIFGYYYGLSMFASPYLKKQEVEGKKFVAFEWLRKILRFSKKSIFEEEKMLEGLIIAMVLHGIYDFILETNLNLKDVLGVFGLDVGINFPLHSLAMAAFLIGGFYYLKKLLIEKDNHIKFGLVGTDAMPEKDYNELLQTIKKMEDEKEVEKKFVKEGFGSTEELRELQNQFNYLQKFQLLEKKYVGDEWISTDKLHEFQKEVDEIKNAIQDGSHTQKLLDAAKSK